MTTFGRHNHFKENYFNPDNCRKIAVAIKKSKVFEHIKPINLLRQKLGLPNKDIFNESIHPYKKARPCDPVIEKLITKENDKEKILENGSLEETSLGKAVTNSIHLLSPGKVTDDISKVFDDVYVKSESLEDKIVELSSDNNHTNIFQVEYLKTKGMMLEKLFEDKAILVKTEKNREKQNKNLYNLATSLLPVPSQLYDKSSLISVLESGSTTSFMNLFKEAIEIENQISSDDLLSIISKVIEGAKTFILPEICSCLEYSTYYSQGLSESFLKYYAEVKEYQENILSCLSTMVEADIEASKISFIEACYCAKDWNMMWSGVLTKDPTYKFDKKYFDACMETFQNLKFSSVSISRDTLIIIISYIMRNYYENYEMYMADIWLYCVFTTDADSETDLQVPKMILEKVIEKLIVMKNPSFLFVMKLLCKNWSLLCNNTFCVWLSELISDKSDVKKCLFSVRESIEMTNENDLNLLNSFLLLSINVMAVLNRKSLFTCSKNVYDTFLQDKLDPLKGLLATLNHKFKYKWIIVECLISSTEYQKALNILKEFDVLKDLEISFVEYSRVKDILPNLVWHLLNISDMLSVIDLFEQVVSIFIFNENNDSSYTKNCNEIFDLIVVKAFESNNKEVVIKMILLLDHILSADIEFNISKECLRYLLVAAVRTDIPFNELLDFIDLCFKFEIFEVIKPADDGFGSFVEVYSNLANEEVSILTTWLCRHVKIKLVDLAQTDGASIRENLMKVCSLKFVLRPSKTSDDFILKLGSKFSFDDLVNKFTDALNCPKYLSQPIKFSSNDETPDEVTITCDNRVVYNAIYYSDI